jgi:hypothetical protein
MGLGFQAFGKLNHEHRADQSSLDLGELGHWCRRG